MLCVHVTDCEAQNAACQIKVAACNDLPYADLIYILMFCSSHQAFNSVAKWWSCLCVDHKLDVWKPTLYKLSDIWGCFAWSDMQNHESSYLVYTHQLMHLYIILKKFKNLH